MSRVLPILFNTEMVRAILDGRKKVTRRVVKFPVNKCLNAKSPYQPGDILYVRETWEKLYYVDPDGYTHYDQEMYFYAADGVPDITLRDADGFELDDQRIRWHPSIHMPKEAARMWLKVTDVRVERLQEITEESAKREGFSCRSEFIQTFLSMHPECTEESWLWVIVFERCGKPESL